MTTAQIIAVIENNLRDTGNDTYSDTIILNAINEAQLDLCEILDPFYLKELVTVVSGTIVSSTYSLSSLTIVGGEKGILRVKDYTTGKWMRKIINVAELNNSFLYPTANDPAYRITENQLYVYPDAKVTLEYLKTPVDLSISFTPPASVANGGLPTLSSDLHFLIAKGGEFRVRATLDDKNMLTQAISKIYYDEINALNKKAQGA